MSLEPENNISVEFKIIETTDHAQFLSAVRNGVVKEHVSMSSLKESNLFLRKLWSELDSIRENGWQYWGLRDANTIIIGQNNFGEVSFDYEEKGCIENIYFKNVDTNDVEVIKHAIENAKKIDDITEYFIIIEIPICLQCGYYEDIKTQIICDGKNTYIYSSIEAYSYNDLRNLLMKKIDIIKAMLAVYFRKIYAIDEIKVTYSKEELKSIDKEIKDYEYDENWMDLDEIPRIQSSGYFLAPKEFICLLDYIMHNHFYIEEVDSIFNSFRVYFSALYLKILSVGNKYDLKGSINVSNSMVVTALEPLASLENVPQTICEHCGQKNFSVVKKIRMLLDRFFEAGLAKRIMNVYYTKRCKFFHEGKRDTEEYYIGICWPQIDERTGNAMVAADSSNDYNMFDWVNYVIRKRTKELLNDSSII